MKPRWTFEHTLYVLAFILALGLRLYHLGAAPLSDGEATWALQALALARGASVEVGAQPGYSSLTGVLMSLLPETNGLARFLPALAGSLLVVCPWFLRSIGFHPVAGVLMAFFLALDPGLAAASRTIGGPMFAVGFGCLGLSALLSRRPALAGISLGLTCWRSDCRCGPPRLYCWR